MSCLHLQNPGGSKSNIKMTVNVRRDLISDDDPDKTPTPKTDFNQNQDQSQSTMTSQEESRLRPDVKEDGHEIDPFSHKLELSPLDWIRTVLGTLLILPVRFVLLFLAVLCAYCCSFFALRNLNEEQKTREPLTGYRKILRSCSSFFGRVAFRVTGFLFVHVKGRQASPEEAPILVVAPHSTFFDGFAAFFSGLPYIVSREENKAIPLIGKCIECAQALCVSREDPKSRQKTVQEIIRRCGSGDPWPQLMIFPEGSCSNRKALMSFKPGAFYPGKSVQPVLIRYPNV